MRIIPAYFSLFVVAFWCMAPVGAAQVTLSSSQTQELADIRGDLTRVASIIRRDRFDEAQQIIDNAEQRLKRIAEEAKLPANSQIVTSLERLIGSQRQVLAVRKNPALAKAQQNTVSFLKHVAPILNARCVKCHGDDPRAKLHLDSYAGMKKGGDSGPLLVVGNANSSLMMLRLCSSMPNRRMPKDAGPLPAEELNVLALWINQGAKFDGDDEETPLAVLLKPKQDLPPITGWEPTGKESVSFKSDIAPWMVTCCLRCHSGNDPKGKLSLETFEGLMRGGERGPVVLPGKPGESLIYQLVGSFDESKRMPANQSKLLRKNWDDLGLWIHEGAKYDGGDPKLLLTSLTPPDSRLKADELATMTPEQFVSLRETRTAQQWKSVLPDQEPQTIKTHQLLLYGNVAAERLGQVKEWSGEHSRTLQQLFGLDEEKRLWTGKLAVFVLKDRADFEKFNQTVTHRRVLAESFADVSVTTTFEDAFVVLQDTGDKSDAETPTLPFLLIEQLTNAYLSTLDVSFPQWLTLGLGPALASREADRRDAYVEALHAAATEALAELEKPTDVFRDGVFFSSDQTRPVGFTLVEFLLTKGGGERRFTQLIKAFEDGGEVGNSIRVAYGADLEPIAISYLSTLKVKPKPKPKLKR